MAMTPLGVESLMGAPPGRSAADDVYDAIRRAIIGGSLTPGERVVEERVANQLNVSRTPVREALLRLERENLVARSGRGMAVRSFSAAEVGDIYDLRAHVESYGARLAAHRITDQELRELRRVQDEMVAELRREGSDELESLKRLTSLNQRFHLTVVRAARSMPLERIMSHVVQTPLIYKSYLWYDEANKTRSAEEHEELIGHLAEGRAEAAERCWCEHIEAGRDILVDKLSSESAWQRSDG